MEFSDTVGREAAPPPTWLYLKDSKDRYDVSMPLNAQGCFSVLTLKQTPADLMDKVKKVCEESSAAVFFRGEARDQGLFRGGGEAEGGVPWGTRGGGGGGGVHRGWGGWGGGVSGWGVAVSGKVGGGS